MRTLVIIVLIILVMVLAGWLAISFNGNSAQVEFRPEAVKKDVNDAAQRTEQLIEGIRKPGEPSAARFPPPSSVLKNQVP